MVYYGWVAAGTPTDPVYNTLKNALKKMPPEAPFRGPKLYKEGEYIYTNSWQGDLERFSGEEQITQNGRLIYQANYRGGLVNQQ